MTSNLRELDKSLNYRMSKADISGRQMGRTCMPVEITASVITVMEKIFPDTVFRLHTTLPENFSWPMERQDLSELLGNLLENALKFTKEGFIEFGYTKVESNLEIYVKDTGIGIKTTRQKSVFERFSKEEEESTKNIDGLGLGLWIAKENTELLGGKISLESKKNSGTTFYVKIPYNPMLSNLKENSETPSNEYLEEENNDHKYTILIAEDEEINFLFLEILLKNQIDLNCTIIHAKNGVEAVEICKKNTEIDIVFMDLKMPVMDGFESVKLIKEFRPDLPIVAQTAFSSNEDKEKVFNAGFNDFISKPISIEDLDAVINRQKE